MLDKIKMARWLDIDKLQDQARDEALLLSTRWDVPQGPDVPEDLRDKNGRYFRTAPDAKGYQSRVGGRMLTEDLVLGSFSPSIPLLFAMVPLLGMLLFLTTGTWLALAVGALALANLVFIATSTERVMWAVGAAAFGFALPLGHGFMASRAAALTHGALGGGSGLLTSLAPLLVVAVIAAAIGGRRSLRLTIYGTMGMIAVVLLSGVVPEFLQSAVLAIPGAALPFAWVQSEEWRRAKRLAIQGNLAKFEDNEIAFSHIAARKQQAERAAADETPFIRYGTAMGVLTQKWDGFAPDAGLPFGQTVKDISTHMLILGSTGRGKTSSLLMPIMVAYLRAKAGGMLVMDGKGSLATLLKELPGYVLLDPQACMVGLYEGMSAVEVALTFKEIFVSEEDSKKDGGMWVNSAYTMALRSAVLLEAMVKHSAREDGPATYQWTMYDHNRLVNVGMQGTEADRQDMRTILTWIERFAGPGDDMLRASIDYYRSELPGMPEDTAGSIKSTLASWMDPILGNPDILRWAKCEKGVSVEQALHGAIVGINLPETKYSKAGRVAASFLKSRFYNAVRLRAEADDGDWRAADPTATSALVVMDEAQLLLNEADHNIAPIARSLGCYLVCSTQTIESIQKTLHNSTSSEAFLDAFQSIISLSSSAGTLDWIKKRVGTTWQPQFGSRGIGIDFVGSATAALGSPLFDSTHHQRKWMTSMLRWGAGGFADVKPGMVSMGDIEEKLAFDLRTTAGTEAWKEVELISGADFKAHTAKQGIALAILNRAGVWRRDFIRLDQVMDTLPADLRSAKPAANPEPEVQPQAEEASV